MSTPAPGTSGTGRDNASWVLPLGTSAGDGWDVAVTDGVLGWQHTRLHVASLADGESRTVDLGDHEVVVVPLSGAARVEAAEAGGERHVAELAGRTSVFAGATDVAYVPRRCRLTGTGTGDGVSRVAIAGATATKGPEERAFRHVTPEEVPVELRGAGIASREVRPFGLSGVLDADSVLVVEVITPAGNWSSWPPHKHDEERAGVESELEEIYYFETRSTDGRGTDPVGYQRVYGSAERPIDVLAEVRTGDVVLVPHGWHGPAVAAPDADLYYLNVMAGPGPERVWRICDDPAHAWVRDRWADETVDPRLPVGGDPP
jgi:5-deoxy-glucuronate isomerase